MQYDFAVAAGASQVMNISGRFFKYKSGTGVIRVRASAGGYVDLLPGQGVWGIEYESLTIQDKSGANNAGVILAGAFDFHDDRITGTVDVVDGGKARTKANQAFLGAVVVPGQAGNAATSQVWMPPGATKIAAVAKIFVSSETAGQIRLLATNIVGVNAGGTPGSKMIGGANGASLLYADSIVGAGVPPGSIRQLAALTVAANAQYVVDFKEPVVIGPGFGLSVQHTLGAAGLNVTYEFIEE